MARPSAPTDLASFHACSATFTSLWLLETKADYRRCPQSEASAASAAMRYAFCYLISSTIDGNSAVSGGGLFASGTGSKVDVRNTIVANSPSGGNCSTGAYVDGGGNVSYPDHSCPGANRDPLLGALRNNGGPMLTMAPGYGGAAIDAGINTTCAAAPINKLDQRSTSRPQGARCISGAYEVAFRNVTKTVTFEGASEAHINLKTGEPVCHEEDVNGDGKIDLVFHFRLGSTGLTCDSTSGTLMGETSAGQAITGTDAVRMVRAGKAK